MGACVHFSRSLPSNSWWQTMVGWQVLSRPSAAEGGGRRPAFTRLATQPYSATEADGWQHELSRVSQNRAAVPCEPTLAIGLVLLWEAMERRACRKEIFRRRLHFIGTVAAGLPGYVLALAASWRDNPARTASRNGSRPGLHGSSTNLASSCRAHPVAPIRCAATNRYPTASVASDSGGS